MNLPNDAWCKHVAMTLALIACAVICGCTETRFASPPGAKLEKCDARWKGLWLPKDEPDSDSAFYIDAACRFVVLDQPKNGDPLKRTPVTLNYVHAGDNNYLVVADEALKPLLEVQPVYGVDPAPAQAFFIARYTAAKDRINVYTVDSELVANRVVANQLAGTVSKTRNELHVFVTGDPARVLEILRDDAIFSAKPAIELVRSKSGVDDFERRARKSVNSKKS